MSQNLYKGFCNFITKPFPPEKFLKAFLSDRGRNTCNGGPCCAQDMRNCDDKLWYRGHNETSEVPGQDIFLF